MNTVEGMEFLIDKMKKTGYNTQKNVVCLMQIAYISLAAGP
jgi:hypothetical protein